MKITTPHGTLKGDNIEAILKEHGYDCLHGADLRYADLSGADLSGADLSGADLRYADLSHADLSDANHVQLSIAKTSILPDEGDIIGWKKAWTDDTMPPKSVIVKLLIPADAQRSNATGRKCRASKARVLDLQDKQGNKPSTRHHGIQRTRHRLHVQKRRNRARRRLRHQPVERMRSRHPLLHHPHRSSRILRMLQMNETRQQKLEYLTDNGYLHNLRGEFRHVY